MERTVDIFVAAIVKIIAKRKFNVRSHQLHSVVAAVCFVSEIFEELICNQEFLMCRLFDDCTNLYDIFPNQIN